MFDDNDEIFEYDILDDRDIDNDDLIDELDLTSEGYFESSKNQALYQNDSPSPNSGNGATGCLIFILVVPIAILLLIL